MDKSSRLRGEDDGSLEAIEVIVEVEDSDDDEVPILRNNAAALGVFQEDAVEPDNAPVVEIPVVADPVEEPPDRPNYNQKMPGLYASSDEEFRSLFGIL